MELIYKNILINLGHSGVVNFFNNFRKRLDKERIRSMTENTGVMLQEYFMTKDVLTFWTYDIRKSPLMTDIEFRRCRKNKETTDMKCSRKRKGTPVRRTNPSGPSKAEQQRFLAGLSTIRTLAIMKVKESRRELRKMTLRKVCDLMGVCHWLRTGEKTYGWWKHYFFLLPQWEMDNLGNVVGCEVIVAYSEKSVRLLGADVGVYLDHRSPITQVEYFTLMDEWQHLVGRIPYKP